RGGAGEIAGADHPRIRLFTVENTVAAMPRSNCNGTWSRCTPETVRSFSAVGYSFGREIERVRDVPVGLISADWGGTRAEAWTSADALAPFPAVAGDLELLAMVRDPAQRSKVVEHAVEGWWSRLDERSPVGPEWMKPSYDDSAWKTMTLPATWGEELESFDGIVHFRKVVDVPANWLATGAQLRLGPIDDMDDAWINGHHLGGEHADGRWNVERRYDVPPRYLRAGWNVIAVRVLDTGGKGGINGYKNQLQLISADQRGLARLHGNWRYAKGLAVADLPPRPEGADIGRNTASVLFNGMIAPLAPYAIRGVVWYQGESNRRRPDQYHRLFPALIEDWRRQWGQDLLPFYFVQIAPFAYGGDTGQAPRLREAQLHALAVPDTGMVVTMDIGDPRDIHPRNKQEVGRRLALWARARTYGEGGLVHSGPLYRSMSTGEGTARLRFAHVGGGLELRPATRSHFRIAGADRRFVEAEARVDGDELVIWASGVPDPVAVRYGWDAASEPNLFNVEGLPASPFRTDEW
ncbi:MAG: hypothetical protein GY715_15230, partial [Planctomycetes bacterium]|nr:hypothetical protein [Planctomycetota bacterium]